MKRNLEQEILQLDGKPFDEKEKMLLQGVCFAAVTTPLRTDSELSADFKMKLYRLAQKVVVGGTVDFTAEELTLLKDRINKVYLHPVIVGRAYDMLDEDPPVTLKAVEKPPV